MAQRGVNKAILIGNLGADPEVRYMPNGDAVANASLATSETWKDKNTGQPVERTEWHRLVFYRRGAEIAGEYLKKGSKIYVEGSLRTRQWEKEGVKHYTTEIIVNSMQMLDRAGDANGGQSAAPREQPRQRPAPTGNPRPAQAPQGDFNGQPQDYPPGSFDGFDDDIPF